MAPIIVLTEVSPQAKICPMVNRPCLLEGCLAYSREDFYFNEYCEYTDKNIERIEIREQCKAMHIWFSKRIEDVKK